MSISNLYFKLPVFLQNAACCVAAEKNNIVRYGHSFDVKLDEYNERSLWSQERIADYRDHRIRALVEHCYKTVPYYRILFKEGGINPANVKSIDDLSLLPVLTKDIVNAQPELFVSEKYKNRPLIHRHTSGTTGSSFMFVMNREAFVEQWAVCWRYWNRLGIKRNTPHAVFGTRRIVPPNQEKPPFWRSKAPSHQLYFSAFHESEANMRHYFDELDKRRFTWIHGYPSLITPLASYMVKYEKKLSTPLRWLTLAAENLLPYQKTLIEEAFGVAPRQHFGSTEGVANASEDSSGVMYIDEDYAAIEFVDFGGFSEIVGTSLTNYAMPLLRWRLRDVAEFRVDSEGRRIITSVDGRAEDYIVLKNGTKIGKLDHVFKDTTCFREVQIVQSADYSIKVLVVPVTNDTLADEEKAKELFAESVGHVLPVSFEYVEKIPKTKTGKLRFVKSEVKNHE